MVTVEIVKTRKEKVRFQISGEQVNYAELIRKYKSGESIGNSTINAFDVTTLDKEETYDVKILGSNKEICLKDIIE